MANLREGRVPVRALQSEHFEFRRKLPGLGHPVKHEAGWADDEHRTNPRLVLSRESQERQRLQRFAETHFVCQDAAEAVFA